MQKCRIVPTLYGFKIFVDSGYIFSCFCSSSKGSCLCLLMPEGVGSNYKEKIIGNVVLFTP